VDIVLPFALILVAFYLLILRPQRARARQADQLRSRLAPGAEVLLTSGLYGTVTEVRDGSVMVEVAPGVTVRFATAAVGRIIADDTSAEDTEDEADDDNTPETATGADAPGETGSEPLATHDDADSSSRRHGAGE
jgi:preprotein translocase subunit YajC